MAIPFLKPLLSGQFRLLKVSIDKNITSVELQNFHLDEAPEYICLSYTWGAESDGYEIIHHRGENVTVRINLAHALRRLHQDLGDDAWLWIDALCIDQSNSAEKSAQIPLMTKIYEKASTVAIWLGLIDPLEEAALQPLADSLDKLQQAFDGLPFADTVTKLKDIYPGQQNMVFWSAIVRLLLNPWFNRTWVVQEACTCFSTFALLGSDFQIIWSGLYHLMGGALWLFMNGNIELAKLPLWVTDSDNFAKLKSHISARHNHRMGHLMSDAQVTSQLDTLITDLFEPWDTMHQFWEARLSQLDSDEPKQELQVRHHHDLFKVFAGRGCTQDQDRIYAMIGLCQGQSRIALTVDVTQHAADVYLEASRLWICGDPALEFLHWIDPEARKELPSWCLDPRNMLLDTIFESREDMPYYTAGIPSDSLSGAFERNHRNTKGAKSDRVTNNLLEMKRQVRDNLAFVVGLHIDEVKDVIPRDDSTFSLWFKLYTDPSPELSQRCRAWLDDCERFAIDNLGSSFHLKPFWRTLTGSDLRREGVGKWTVEQDRGPSYKGIYERLRSGESFKASDLAEDEVQFFDDLLNRTRFGWFVTSSGRLGRSTGNCGKGDEVVVFPGATVPFLLRSNDDGSHIFHGAAYVDGIMHGEAFELDTEMKVYTIT